MTDWLFDKLNSFIVERYWSIAADESNQIQWHFQTIVGTYFQWNSLLVDFYKLFVVGLLQALPYVCLLLALLFFIYAIIGMQVRP